MTVKAFGLKLTHPVVAIIAVNSNLETLAKELDKVNRSYLVAGSTTISHPTDMDENISIQLNIHMLEKGVTSKENIKFRAEIINLNYSEDRLNPPADMDENNFYLYIETIKGERLYLDAVAEYKVAERLLKSLSTENIIDIIDRSASADEADTSSERIAAFVRNGNIVNEDTYFGRLKNLFICERNSKANIFKATLKDAIYYEVSIFDKTRANSNVAVYHTFNPAIKEIIHTYYPNGFTYDIADIGGFQKYADLHKLLSNSVSGMIKNSNELKNIRVHVHYLRAKGV